MNTNWSMLNVVGPPPTAVCGTNSIVWCFFVVDCFFGVEGMIASLLRFRLTRTSCFAVSAFCLFAVDVRVWCVCVCARLA